MITYYLLVTNDIAAWLSGITFASKAKIESSILSAAVCASGSVVEHRLAKARAAGSNPVSRFKGLRKCGSPFFHCELKDSNSGGRADF